MMLDISGITVGYGSKTVVSNLSFGVGEGRITALLGHNGAGKTSTLKAIMGLLPARGGDIRFDGRSITGLDVARRVEAGLRLLPEGRGIYPDLSVADNIEVTASLNCGPKATFVPADIFRLFPILSERAKQLAGTMSGGQQQMLAFGLAMLGEPRMLLLDEPSIGLAPNLVSQLFATVKDVCKSRGVTAVLVEQNVAEALRIADMIVIMNNGEIVFDGTPDEARSSSFWNYF